MISIITAIHNQLDMNKMFWKYLVQYTDNEFELIIIDNVSNDGSREFFESLGPQVIVIANTENYSYPHCQNQGIKAAKYDTLAFLNNDLLVSEHWDSRLLQVLGRYNQHVVSLASNDRLFDKASTKRISRRWKYIKYPLIYLFKGSSFSLNTMRILCYGNWKSFCEKIFKKYGLTMTLGFSGSAIVMNRTALDLIGEWDVSQQSADFDIFFRTCQRSEQQCDIRPIATINGIFVHHYRRLTLYCSYPPFADAANLRALSDKWDANDRARWMNIVNFKNSL